MNKIIDSSLLALLIITVGGAFAPGCKPKGEPEPFQLSAEERERLLRSRSEVEVTNLMYFNNRPLTALEEEALQRKKEDQEFRRINGRNFVDADGRVRKMLSDNSIWVKIDGEWIKESDGVER